MRFSGQEFILLHGPWPRTMLSPKWRTKQQQQQQQEWLHDQWQQVQQLEQYKQHQMALQVPDNQLRHKQAQQIAACPMQLSSRQVPHAVSLPFLLCLSPTRAFVDCACVYNLKLSCRFETLCWLCFCQAYIITNYIAHIIIKLIS